MTDSKKLILKLKEVRDEKGLSLADIEVLTEKNGEHVSIATLSRVFADGSEDGGFRYESTLKPIANAVLDIDTIEEDDDLDTQALKILLQYKADKIKELEAELNYEKVKHHDKLEMERERSRKSIEFLKEQIERKDAQIEKKEQRIDLLLEAVFTKDKHQKELLEKILGCPYGKKVIESDD